MSSSSSTPSVSDQEWSQAGDSARDAAASVGGMANHAACAVGAMASQKADDLAAGAGVGIQSLGYKLSQHSPHEGAIGSATQAFARTVKDGGQYLEEAKLSGLTEDVAKLIRRYPVSAVLIAVGVGWFASRKLKF